ncbi:heterokaryon incompatibility protein-domain-containing protein [Echria macrotheca]|uniref:Heterokaryon incompatibility protein-domain-containing protein n=1 Tax=Echria macrotheca TaxID=438768 RepID=A0AAJ0BC79_9PEZI|nr:heterokaryon incompatibility protein-domain-containing protein [Echria macrotheca]
MCQKVYAIYRCADFHESKGQTRDRFKYIRDCAVFRDGLSPSGCGEWQRVHDLQEDNPEDYCLECLGKRTPELPKSHEEPQRPDDQLASRVLDPPRRGHPCLGDRCGGFHADHIHAISSRVPGYDLIKKSAADGCSFAMMVICVLNNIGFATTWQLEIRPDNAQPGLPPPKYLRVKSGNPYEDFKRYELFTPLASPWRGILSKNPITPDPFDNSCVEQIRIWLQDCLCEHEKCRLAEPASLPTRVVDIGSVTGKESPVLYVSKGERVPYATLSYCWGANMRCLTTKETISRFQEGISLAEMPATFRDAVLITRRLGIRYLWIDALCIVQDDDEDWRRESGRMASVYGHSTITLDATASRSASEGLSPKRPPLISHQHTDRFGIEHTVYIRECIYHGFLYNAPASDHPTFGRGWCLQERLLSRRVVHFTRQEVVWDCRSMWMCECGIPAFFPFDRVPGQPTNHPADMQNFHSWRQSVLGNRVHQDPKIHEQWQRVLSLYSNGRLTYDEDMLPALSGIAQSLYGTQLGRYYAGLWETNLIHQLMWVRKPRFVEGKANFGRNARKYTAPSFSPLSRVGVLEDFPWHLGFPYDNCKVVDIRVKPSGSDPTGAIAEGEVTITGMLFRFYVATHQEPPRSIVPEFCDMKCHTPSGGTVTVYWRPDADELVSLVPVGCDIVLLRLSFGFYMVLFQQESTGKYTRIGGANIDYKRAQEEFDKLATLTTVTIV